MEPCDFLKILANLVKQIQHFTEQRTKFVPGEMLDSFDHLYCARCCSVLLGAARCCSVLLGAAPCCSVLLCTAPCCSALFDGDQKCWDFICLTFSSDAKVSNSMLFTHWCYGNSRNVGHNVGLV